MIILKNKKEQFNSINPNDLFNYIINDITISNFKYLTDDMKQVIKSFMIEHSKLKFSEAKRLFSKLFNQHTSKNINYWIVRGWSKEDAIIKISSDSKKSSLKAKMKLQEMKKDTKVWEKFKDTKPTTLNYYINKGMTKEEAKKALKERQTTFSKEKMIKKYGKEVGLEKLKKRNNKWLNSLKENNDWDELSKSKAVSLEKMIIKYGEEEGTEKYHNWKESTAQTKDKFIKRFGEEIGEEKWNNRTIRLHKYSLASMESIEFFIPILEKIKNKIDDSEIYIGIGDKYEYWLKYKTEKSINNTFFYDLTIRNINLIIEYHGTHVHPNPKWDKDKWNNWKHAFQDKNADEAREFDLQKKSLAESQGFKVIEVWNDDDLSFIQKSIIEEIVSLL